MDPAALLGYTIQACRFAYERVQLVKNNNARISALQLRLISLSASLERLSATAAADPVRKAANLPALAPLKSTLDEIAAFMQAPKSGFVVSFFTAGSTQAKLVEFDARLVAHLADMNVGSRVCMCVPFTLRKFDRLWPSARRLFVPRRFRCGHLH